MTQKGSCPSKRNDRHDDHRLDVGPEFKSQQNVHTQQGDTKPGQDTGKALLCLLSFAFPVKL